MKYSNKNNENEIKPSELRIGNLLMWEDNSKEIISVTEILKRENYYSVSFEGGCAELGEFIPIRLTKEWLLKLGFKIGDNKICNEHFYYKEFNYKLFTINPENGIFTITSEINDHFIQMPVTLSVHQLQNRYFMATEQELI